MKKLLKIDQDVLGASASFLCAIHCAMVPLIVTFGMLSGISFIANHIWDLIFIGLSFVLAFSSLLNGYRKHHRELTPIITASLGFVAIVVGHLLSHEIWQGNLLSVVGGIAVAVAHILNYRSCRSCKLCRD